MNTEHPSEADRRAARRAAVRAHHPDVGGDPAELQQALEATQRPAAELSGPIYEVRPTSRMGRARHRARRGVRTLRTRLPRVVPGSTRYHPL